MKFQATASCFGDFHLPCEAFSAPFPSNALLPIKKGREILGLFSFSEFPETNDAYDAGYDDGCYDCYFCGYEGCF